MLSFVMFSVHTHTHTHTARARFVYVYVYALIHSELESLYLFYFLAAISLTRQLLNILSVRTTKNYLSFSKHFRLKMARNCKNPFFFNGLLFQMRFKIKSGLLFRLARYLIRFPSLLLHDDNISENQIISRIDRPNLQGDRMCIMLNDDKI